ncbi:hypothetical protein CSUI_010591, partial [Cystoisospora suis]
ETSASPTSFTPSIPSSSSSTSVGASTLPSAPSSTLEDRFPSCVSVKIANAKQAALELSVQHRLIPHLEKAIEDLEKFLQSIQEEKALASQSLSALRTREKNLSLGRICKAIEKKLLQQEEEREQEKEKEGNGEDEEETEEEEEFLV